MSALRKMLPDEYQSAIYWDDEAAMRAFLDDVEELAKCAVHVARWLDQRGTINACMSADELHAAAATVRPGVEDL